MKRRVFALLLCVCALVSCAAVLASASGEVCFISVNDTLLELSSMPYFKDGVIYMPYWVFTNFGIGYRYFSEGSTAMVFQGAQVLFFDLIDGTAYDVNDAFYPAEAVLRDGVVYLPVQFMQSFFGTFVYSYIQGGRYGDIARLTDSRAVLTSSDFAKAASSLMQSRYNAYIASLQSSPTPSPSPTPPPAPPPSPQVTEEPGISHEGTEITLSFIGLPGDQIISSLEQYGVTACFYLSADDIRSSPDTVRRLTCEGYPIGILCIADVPADYAEASGLLFEAARAKTVMVTSLAGDTGAMAAAAEAAGLSFWHYDVGALQREEEAVPASTLALVLEERYGNCSVFIACSEENARALPELLQYLDEERYILSCPSETDVWSFFE